MLAPLGRRAAVPGRHHSAFWYLRAEERARAEAVKRDVEYAQQRMRLRLLERQEQLGADGARWFNKDVGRPRTPAGPSR